MEFDHIYFVILLHSWPRVWKALLSAVYSVNVKVRQCKSLINFTVVSSSIDSGNGITMETKCAFRPGVVGGKNGSDGTSFPCQRIFTGLCTSWWTASARMPFLSPCERNSSNPEERLPPPGDCGCLRSLGYCLRWSTPPHRIPPSQLWTGQLPYSICLFVSLSALWS